MENHPKRKDEWQDAVIKTSRQDVGDRKRKCLGSRWLTPQSPWSHGKKGKRVPWLWVDVIFIIIIIINNMVCNKHIGMNFLSQMLLCVFLSTWRVVWALVDFSRVYVRPEQQLHLFLGYIFLTSIHLFYCSQSDNQIISTLKTNQKYSTCSQIDNNWKHMTISNITAQ